MERLKRISEFWNWLPAFRAVAETEHVRTAAKRLSVSPSALSRAVGLLEDNIGAELFEREGRGITLNRTGRQFLNSLRAAMRLIDDGFNAVESESIAGPVNVAVPDDLVRIVIPRFRRVQRRHPDLRVYLRDAPRSSITTKLVQGEIDIAFSRQPTPHDELDIEHFLSGNNGIYCGAQHPLFGEEATRDEVLDHGFVAGLGDDGSSLDGWPYDVERDVRLYVDRLQAAVDACAFDELLAALPDFVARPYVERGILHRLPVDVVSPTDYYIVHRKRVIESDRISEIVDELHED